MCTGKCSRFIALALYPLAVLSIVLNIALFFPAGKTIYTKDDRITEEVKYMGGLIGGGAMVLLPALYIHLTASKNCCSNRCGMFLSIGFAAVGVAGGLYNLAVSAVALQNGPLCDVPILGWTTPFKDGDGKYLTDDSAWNFCIEPKNIVQFHIGMFATLLVIGGLEIILCAVQMVNGLAGCLCGTCGGKETV